MAALPKTIKAVNAPGSPFKGIPANDNLTGASGRGRIVFLGEPRPYIAKPQLVRDTMPRTGVGFFGGQSGAYKTFFAIHAATCFMTGEPLAGREIERTGGVVYLAAEGEGTIEGRLIGRRTRLDNPDEVLPFYMLTGMGGIADEAAYGTLKTLLKAAADDMRSRFDVDMVAIIVDTVAAAGMIPEDKENDPGAWQRVFDALQPISTELDILVILIHHAGKNASAGLRGSSNARAGADFALMLSCDRDEITGLTANHHLHLAKSRDAPEGPIAAIQAQPVVIGSRDDDSPVTTLVLDFAAGAPSPKRKRRETPADKVFREAFESAMVDKSETVRVHGEASAPLIRAVAVDHVRADFWRLYPSGQDDPRKRDDNIRKRFPPCLQRAVATGGYCSAAWAGREWIWRPDSAS